MAPKIIKNESTKGYFTQWYEGRPWFRHDKTMARKFDNQKDINSQLKKIKAYYKSVGKEHTLKVIGA